MVVSYGGFKIHIWVFHQKVFLSQSVYNLTPVNPTSSMKKVPFFLALFFYFLNSTAQVTGIKNVPGDYANLSDVITALNTSGVGAGGVTINITAAQTAPAGGYQLGSAVLNASISAANQLKFTGNNNIITAQAGTSTNLDGRSRLFH